MIKAVRIEYCDNCPNSNLLKKNDTKYLLVQGGCNLTNKSFGIGMVLTDRFPIPGWCPLPDAEGLIAFKESFDNGMEPLHADTWALFQAWRG